MARQSRGFSVVEIMVVIAITGIAATLSVQGLNTMYRRNRFDEVVRSTSNVILGARFNALRTGLRTAVSIENRQVIAFTDTNNNKQYDAGEAVIARYPSTPGAMLPDGIEIDCITLRERGNGPRTAFFDARGFYIDVHDGVARHNANLCVSDQTTQRQRTIAVSLFGNVAPTTDGCEPKPFICPDVAPD